MKCVKRLACALLALLLACAGCMAEEEETEDALSDLAVLSESIGVALAIDNRWERKDIRRAVFVCEVFR